jgi:GTPase SAR1 family protein
MRIGITGAQSVGKTTLIQALIQTSYFKDYHVFDSPTRYLKQEYDIGFDTGNTDVQLSTLALQLYHVNQYKNALFDRTVIDNLSYFFYHQKRHNTNMSKQVEYFMYEMSQAFMENIDYTFVLSPEFPIEADGIREVDERQRKEIVVILTRLLPDFAHSKFEYISGPIDTRVEQIVSCCKKLEATDEDNYVHVASLSMHSPY